MPKIISESCELVKFSHINCSGPVFFWRHTVSTKYYRNWQTFVETTVT